MKFRIVFAGFGVVAQGLTELLLEKQQMLKNSYGLEWQVVAVSDIHKGSVLDNNGIDMSELLSLTEKGQSLENCNAEVKGLSVLETIAKADANLLVEVTYTDVHTGKPAIDHIRAAFNKGWHVVTTNKGPLINYGQELINMAIKKNLGFGYEGVVMSGTPTIGLALRNLAGSTFTEIKGILNGTTNYILTEMEKGLDYPSALKQAQTLGYAEADPTADVEGWDALGKIIVMANLLMGVTVKPDTAYRKGITEIKAKDIEDAKANGKKWRLIARAEQKNDNVKISVAPELIPITDPLANVSGPTNALTLTFDTLGAITIVGPGAGKKETGYALLADILEINRLYNR
jgi:homoserine dehydrogenase